MRKVNAGLVFGLGVSVAGMCLGGGCTKTQVVVATNPQAGFATLTQNEEAHIHTVHKVMRQDYTLSLHDALPI